MGFGAGSQIRLNQIWPIPVAVADMRPVAAANHLQSSKLSAIPSAKENVVSQQTVCSVHTKEASRENICHAGLDWSVIITECELLGVRSNYTSVKLLF